VIIDHFVGGSYQALSPIVDNEETINLVIERLSPAAAGAKAAKAFTLRPGARTWATPAIAAASRASFEDSGRLFKVIGVTFYEFDANGNATARGTVAINANPATISSNGDGGNQLFITSGDKGYIFNLSTNGFTEEVSSGCTMGGYLDTRFVYLDAATSSLYQSARYDGTTWDPTEFTQRGLAGDPWRALCVLESQREILLCGDKTSDRYFNNGDSPFPFRPRPDGLIPHGIAAPFSVTDVGGMVLWIGQTKRGQGYVVALSGAEVKRVSHAALDLALEGIGSDELERFEGDAFDLNGHTYYLAAHPDITHVFDLTTGEWVKWLSFVDGAYVGWRPVHHVFAFGKHLMGDRETSQIWEITHEVYTDVDGEPIRWLRRCPLPWANNVRVTVPRVELLHEPGLGTGDDGQGDDPVAIMRLSFDGGKTFGAERSRRLGEQGEWDTQAVWNRCGSGMKPVIEFYGTDPAPVRIVGLEVEMTRGEGRAA
jgi:hypothetical protein